MRQKYHESIRFFTDQNDKKQQGIAVIEYQRFSYFYHEKMQRYLTFDPHDGVEDDVYQRLSKETQDGLNNPAVVKQILIVCNRKA